MAETAALTSAHAHARKAAEDFAKTHRDDASEEHQRASDDFSRAARSTNDGEALRVLKLLEQQHHRLAQIIQSQDAAPVETQRQIEGAEPVSSVGEVPLSAATEAPQSQEALAKTKSPQSASIPGRIGSQMRESSPSLARDIASRRGIPASGRTPSSAAAQARAKQSSPESRRTRQPGNLNTAANIPPSIVDSQANLREARKSKKTADDEGFAKFYNNLTSDTMSKLSSVLAYAGLPLTADDIKSDQPTQKRTTVSAGNEPDVKKYISKAALDAVEEDHRQRGTLGHGFGPAESFYVVQTGGGTYSYADIAKAKQSHLSGIDEEDDDAFVDAKELPGPSSPAQSRTTHNKRSSFGKNRTQEELELENSTLKGTLEDLARRLSNFEAHAQDASMAALTQSMVSLRPPQAGSDSAMQERLTQMEKQIEQHAEERQTLEDRAAKQEKMLKKYHSKWEQIKSSAKERDKVKKEKAEKGGDYASGA